MAAQLCHHLTRPQGMEEEARRQQPEWEAEPGSVIESAVRGEWSEARARVAGCAEPLETLATLLVGEWGGLPNFYDSFVPHEMYLASVGNWDTDKAQPKDDHCKRRVDRDCSGALCAPGRCRCAWDGDVDLVRKLVADFALDVHAPPNSDLNPFSSTLLDQAQAAPGDNTPLLELLAAHTAL
mmetsp:Transcript_52526/g.122171  ORF Transcript_52526/g.122171 Transcript_52526/m.122171 type:complete len:182 (+) Transcript_52526:35-580(+)